MHSCTCRKRETLADRINAIIAKYESCSCPTQNPEPPSCCKICLSNIISTPCLPCPASSCCPQPSPGPGLRRYISRKELCPSLKGCLSLYRRPCPPPTSYVSCCTKSKASCAALTSKSKPRFSVSSSPTPPPPCRSCRPCTPCPSIPSTSCCPCNPTSNFSTTQQAPSCSSYSPSRCCSSGGGGSQCCYSPTSSVTPANHSKLNCCTNLERRRLTALDDPPYSSFDLEREFSNRFIRLDPCYCETDSSSSLDTGNNFGSRFR